MFILCLFCIVYCSENRLKINITLYVFFYYMYLIYRDKIYNLEGYIF